MNDSKYFCPQCGGSRVRSVPLLYRRGNFNGTVTNWEQTGTREITKVTKYADGREETKVVGSEPVYGYVTHSVASMSDEARRLAPPVKPELYLEKENISGSSTLIFALIFNPFHGISLKLFCFELLLIAMVCYLQSVHLFVGFGVLFFLVRYANEKNKAKRIKKVNEAAKNRYAEDLKYWQIDMDEWEHSFECQNCGHVFVIDS